MWGKRERERATKEEQDIGLHSFIQKRTKIMLILLV